MDTGPDDGVAWLLRTTNRMVSCRTVASLLDLAYDAIREGLGYDRVGLMTVDADGTLLVEHIGTDEHGRKFYPRGRVSRLPDGDYHARLLADPRLQETGPGFILVEDTRAGVPAEALARFDGCPRQMLRVALRVPERVVGLISVDNLPSGRPLTPDHAPPLVAFANALAAALENVRVLEERERRIGALDADLRQRVAELEWLREISRQVNAAGTLEGVLDVVYDGIRAGLGYDRVGIDLLDYEAGTFVEYLGTDATGQKTRPAARVASLGQDSPIWTMPSVAAILRGAWFFYTADAYADWPEEMRYVLDGMPRQLLQVPLCVGEKVVGIISVDNLLTQRPIAPGDAAPLLALAHQVGTAVENARLREIERAERARLERASLTDHLTDLGNHRAFHEHFSRAAAHARRQGEPLALALIDIDDFKLINDRHGHGKGDRVLAAVGAILRAGRAGDGPYRIGGDEFALILPATTVADAERLAERLCREAEGVLGGATLSVGVAGALPGEADLESLREEADAALYEAKRRGRNRVVGYAEIRDTVSVTAPAQTEAVRRLLAEGHIGVAFQPIWDLESGSLFGVEALCRPSPAYGLSGPQEAFEVAAKLGYAQELDTLCRRAILGKATGLPATTLLFLNVAQQTLERGILAGTTLVQEVEDAGLSPHRVVLEISERAGARPAALIREAQRLRSMGFRLALDDMGAGETGLALLSRLPVDMMKIDRSLLARAMSDSTARAVLGALAAFALHTGTYVIAEGIETEPMLEFVRRAGGDGEHAGQEYVHGVQGYLLGRPMESVQWAPPAALRAGAAAKPVRWTQGA